MLSLIIQQQKFNCKLVKTLKKFAISLFSQEINLRLCEKCLKPKFTKFIAKPNNITNKKFSQIHCLLILSKIKNLALIRLKKLNG